MTKTNSTGTLSKILLAVMIAATTVSSITIAFDSAQAAVAGRGGGSTGGGGPSGGGNSGGPSGPSGSSSSPGSGNGAFGVMKTDSELSVIPVPVPCRGHRCPPVVLPRIVSRPPTELRTPCNGATVWRYDMEGTYLHHDCEKPYTFYY